MVTRVPVLEVRPCLDRGRHPATLVPGEELRVDAIVLADDVQVGAAVVLTGPDGTARPPVPLTHVGDDVWSAVVTADEVGAWTYHVVTWQEPLRTWASRVVEEADRGADTETLLALGSSLVLGAGEQDPAAFQVAEDLLDDTAPAHERLAVALAYVGSLPEGAGRVHHGASDPLPLRVDPERSLVGAWYQMFPLSEGAVRRPDGTVEPGTWSTAAKGLEAVAALGFDVVRLPPVHPSADASPWSVGSAAGGHDAVDPRLGTGADLAAFVDRAHELGLEVALELALEVSSEHPWLAEHSGWLVPVSGDRWRIDVDADPGAVYLALLQTVSAWIERGVSAFVVRDAHRWPLAFWEQLLGDVARTAPDVVVLAEGDASAAQTHALGLVGFHQTTRPLHGVLGVHDAEEVLASLARGSVGRPHLLASSSHHLPAALVGASPATFRAWAALAALSSPAWGVAAGFTAAESAPVDHGRRHAPDVDGPVVREAEGSTELATFLTRLNEVRRAHPSLLRRRGLTVHPVHHAGVIAFSRVSGDDVVLVVVDLFPAFGKTVAVQGPFGADVERLRDDLDGSWHPVVSVSLDPDHPVRVLTTG